MNSLGTIVTKRFRDRAFELYPALVDNRRYRAFFDLLLFGSFLEGSNPPTKVLPHRSVLEALGLPHNTRARDFTSGPFIEEFNENVVAGKLIIGPYSHVYRKSRTVSLANLGKQFLAELDNELRTFYLSGEGDRIHFISGDAWKPLTPVNLRTSDLAVASQSPGLVPPAQRLIGYLNTLPSNVFTSTIAKKKMANAIQVAEQIPNATIRRHQLALLQRIASQPQPFYGGSTDQKTVRIFARNPSVLQLRNEIKHVLVSDWTTFDLRSAQLAIIAKDWGIDDLSEVLSDRSRNIWNELSTTLGKLPVGVAKSAVKKGVYAIAYGAREATVRREIIREIEAGIADDCDVDVRSFFEHSIIKNLFLYRTATLDVIKKQRGATDCFGRNLSVRTNADARSVLAQLSQAQEMQLLLPVLDLAEQRPADLRIMLWEHDGFTVHLRRPDRVDGTKRAIVKTVNAECKKLGYATELAEK